jgi:putative oxidoreductase
MTNTVNKREALEFADPGSARIALSEARWVRPEGGPMPMREWWDWLWDVPVGGPKATALLRLMAGSVFLWEGIIKFVFANQGIGRFTKLGFPFPGPTADLVAVVEIVGGALLLAGLQTRLVGMAFVVEMIVAVLSTKISMFLGTSPLPLPPVAPQIGFWAVLHEVRSEFAQMFVSLFLLLEGPGQLSVDAWRKNAARLDSVRRPAFASSPADGSACRKHG